MASAVKQSNGKSRIKTLARFAPCLKIPSVKNQTIICSLNRIFLAIFMVVGVFPVHATLTAYEPFNYPQGVLATGTATTGIGTGFTGSWTCGASGTIVAGLAYPGLPMTGNALESTAYRQAESFASPLARTGTNWISFLYQAAGGNPGGNNNGVYFPNGGLGLYFGFGLNPYSQTQGYLGLGVVNTAGASATTASPLSAAYLGTYGTIYLVVLEIEYNTSGSNDTVRVFINPATNSSTPGAAAAMSYSSFSVGTITGVGLQDQGGGGVYVDEIRVGTTYGDVLAQRLTPAQIKQFPYVPAKKFIQFGWDSPSAAWVAANFTSNSLESKPFDGMAMWSGNNPINLFDPTGWLTNAAYLDTNSLAQIPWNKFRGNNFLILWSEDGWHLDYWNDATWASISNNMVALARAATNYGFAGILLDAEPYYGDPWGAATNLNGHTLAQAQAQARVRGAQVMNAWQSGYTNITILATFLLSVPNTNWVLLPYFVNGMLDAMGPPARLVEGDELLYYCADTRGWFDRYYELKISKTALTGYLDPANAAKWTRQVQVGTTIYWDLVMNTNANQTAMAAQDRWEHNNFFGLAAADEWVWVYTEGMNWWGVPPAAQPNGMGLGITGIYPGSTEGITNAHHKYFNGQPLGWDWYSSPSPWGTGVKDTSITVTITNPSNGIQYGGPTSIVATATASSTGGSITAVDFYLNVVMVGTVTTAPYVFTLNNVPEGEYTLIALATDSSGHHGTSNPVDIKVLNSAVLPTLAVQISSGYPLLSLQGMLGSNFIVQYNTNLAANNWMNLLVISNLPSSPYQFLDPAGITQPMRFYRASPQ